MKAKSLRVGISIGLLFFFLFLFLGFRSLIHSAAGHLLVHLQFTPTLIKSLAGSAVSIIFLSLIIAMTALFGRLYCSFLCPMGVFQDIISYISSRLRRRKYCYIPPYSILWYGLTGVIFILFFLGILKALHFFDPFSLWGKVTVFFLKPIGIILFNFLIRILERFDQYLFTPMIIQMAPFLALITLFSFMMIPVLLSYFKGRSYCNTLCPVGGFLSLFARISLFKFVIDKNQCTHCGKCERVCKTGCMDSSKGCVDFSRCVMCLNCLDTCSFEALHYTPSSSLQTFQSIQKRRVFLKKIVIMGSGLSIWGNSSEALKPKALPSERSLKATPPGSISLSHFNHRCIACGLCATSCHTHVLGPISPLQNRSVGQLLERRTFFYKLMRKKIYVKGAIQVMQPFMNFDTGLCDYTCNTCSQVCPTKAITFISLKEKQRTKIGEVQFIKEKCIVHTKKRDCGACAEVCPTHAVYTQTINNIRHPKIKASACIGCGACQKVCPVKPDKAILVSPLKVHEKADPPFMKSKPETKTEIIHEDFPF